VRIFNDKKLVARFFPDASYVVDEKDRQLRHLKNT